MSRKELYQPSPMEQSGAERVQGEVVVPDESSDRILPQTDSVNLILEKVKDERAAQYVLKQLEGMKSAESVAGLSQEERKVMEQNFLHLKELIATEKLSEKAITFLLSAEVVTVIAGVKPESYVQPSVARNKLLGRFFKSRPGMTPTDLDESERIIWKLGFEVGYPDFGTRGEAYKKERSTELMYVYDKGRALKRMDECGLFTTGEMQLAQDDFVGFQASVLALGSGQPPSSVYRCAVLYGYPLDDVKQYINLQKIQEKLEQSLGEKFTKASAAERRKLLDDYAPLATKEERRVIERSKEESRTITIRGQRDGTNQLIGYTDSIGWRGVGDSVERDNLVRKYQEVLHRRDELFPTNSL